MEQNVIVFEKASLPIGIKGGKGGVKPFINTFTTTIKPALNQLTMEINSFFYPCDKVAQNRKDFVWLTNKYGQQIGKRFVIQALPNGLRFFLTADNLPAEKHTLTEKYANVVGLETAIAPIVPETVIVPSVETPADQTTDEQAS